MKKLVSMFLATVVFLSLAACGKNKTPQTDSLSTDTTAAPTESLPETNPEPPKSIKILAIGNSFSVDTMWHLYTVAKAEGVEKIILGTLYVGGCTLKQHAEFAIKNEPAYRYYKNNSGAWIITEDTTILSALQDEQWDVITMQQGSSDSGVPISYSPYLENLIDYVLENTSNPDNKLFWHMTWAYQSDSTHSAFKKYGSNQQTMYNCIVNTVSKVIKPNTSISGIIPVGTAIQNARTSYMGDRFTRDGYHLSEFGRLIASYTWYAVLTGHDLHTINLKYFSSKTLTQAEKDLIIGSVNAALADPYTVTAQ